MGPIFFRHWWLNYGKLQQPKILVIPDPLVMTPRSSTPSVAVTNAPQRAATMDGKAAAPAPNSRTWNQGGMTEYDWVPWW